MMRKLKKMTNNLNLQKLYHFNPNMGIDEFTIICTTNKGHILHTSIPYNLGFNILSNLKFKSIEGFDLYNEYTITDNSNISLKLLEVNFNLITQKIDGGILEYNINNTTNQREILDIHFNTPIIDNLEFKSQTQTHIIYTIK